MKRIRLNLLNYFLYYISFLNEDGSQVILQLFFLMDIKRF